MNSIYKTLAKSPFVQMIITWFIILTFCLGTIFCCLNTLDIGLRLYLISDEILDINSSYIQNDQDVARYNELQQERQAIKDNSLVGYFLVTSGGNFFYSMLRMLLLTLVCPCLIIYSLYFSFIQSRRAFRLYMRMRHRSLEQQIAHYKREAKKHYNMVQDYNQRIMECQNELNLRAKQKKQQQNKKQQQKGL